MDNIIDTQTRAKAASGDEDARSFVLARFTGPLVRLAEFITKDRGLAEDAAQMAMDSVSRSDDPEKWRSAYFAGATRNKALHILKKRRRERSRVADEMPDAACPSHGPGQRTTMSEIFPAVEAALLMLPIRQREVLRLRLVHEHSYAKIGTQLGMTENTAKSIGQRATAKLQQRLRDCGFDPAEYQALANGRKFGLAPKVSLVVDDSLQPLRASCGTLVWEANGFLRGEFWLDAPATADTTYVAFVGVASRDGQKSLMAVPAMVELEPVPGDARRKLTLRSFLLPRDDGGDEVSPEFVEVQLLPAA
jgi:RNA polymerase sigma-70 factor (ECF subfamily)